MVDLRCFDIADGGSCWIVRCKHCAAGWLPSKDAEMEPLGMIEHAMSHAKRLTQAEELERRITAVNAVLAAIGRDLASDALTPAPGRWQALAREQATYAAWLAPLARELDALLARPLDRQPARRVKQPAEVQVRP